MDDPDYHYREIMDALKTAASKMPRVDAIGVSAAGIYISNRVKVASLLSRCLKTSLKTCRRYVFEYKEGNGQHSAGSC